MTSDQLVSQNLDRWKEHLLDTSKRNRLLYFQPTSAVQLVEPDLGTLWERLVKRPKPQTFFGQQTDVLSLVDETETESEGEIVIPQRTLKADEIATNPNGAKLNRLLYGLRSKSNLSLEEQGLTTLYVAWGFLRWRDTKTNEEIVSPLILSPMTLIRESSGAIYRLKLSEDDLWLNPVLEWKLAADHKIQLPQLPAFEDTDPFEYFDQVREAVSKRSGWNVWEAAYLGLFSFHKMAMYQDLRDGGELALRNPFVRALGGDPALLPEVPTGLPKGEELDSIRMAESFGVLDCDSSQNAGVQAARKGVSFVLQGPPGTGKSQTIANIIAHCLADGKRVLFVSEKMAALDVVHSRLEKVGLGLFCLKAHSQSATKKEVVADLGKTLTAARTGAQMNALRSAERQDETDLNELERLRLGLNHHASEVHRPRSPLGLSVYEVAGELALRSEATDIVAPLPTPYEADGETLARLRELLQAAQGYEPVWRQGDAHPWHGVAPRPISMDLFSTLRARGTLGAALSRELDAQARALAQRCGVAEPQPSLARAEKLPVIAELLNQLEMPGVRRPPAMWFVLEDLAEHLNLATGFKAAYQAVSSRRAALDARYRPTFWQMPHSELIEKVTTRHEATLSRCGTWEEFPTWSSEVIKRLEHVAHNLEVAHRSSSAVGMSLPLRVPESLVEAGYFSNAVLALQADFAKQKRAVAPQWFDAEQLPALKLEAATAREQARLRDEHAAHLAHYNLDAMKSADLAAMSARFENEYSGVLRVLKSVFRSDLKQLALWRKDGAKIPYETALADLQQAARWQQHSQWLGAEAKISAHRAQFAGAYTEHSTSWQTIEADLEACERVTKAFARVGGMNPELVRRVVAGEVADSSPGFADLCAALTVLREETPWLQTTFSLQNLPFEKEGAALSFVQAPLADTAHWLRENAVALKDVGAAFDVWMQQQLEPKAMPSALVADAREALEVLRLEANLLTESESVRERFATLFDGADTDWDAVISALDWTYHALVWWREWQALGGQTGEEGQALPEFIAIATGDSPFAPGSLELPQAMRLREEWAYFDALFVADMLPRATLLEDAAWFQSRVDSASQLEAMLRWLEIVRELQESGLYAFWQMARTADLGGKALVDAFERRFWSLWMDGALERALNLRDFDGQRHTAASRRFIELDTSSLGAAQRRLSSILWKKKPLVSSGDARTGEIAILQKEVVKKARLKPLRRLFREIPHLLSALKPCILMSPLAVAQFLEAERTEFDLVIFDEASQILPEDAVGAILRSKQIVVVGDRKQLPPTSFFASGGLIDSDDEEENGDDSSLYESILDMCAPHLPNYMLLWHYRSRDEALISFSNRHFYDGRLITFPSPYQGGVQGRGVRLESVEGIYYRGKGKDARTNPVEAARVADLVIEHFERSPRQSLGVIALNATQARAIDEALQRRLMARPELEELASPHRSEHFFIKALENVQGDERDVILLSIAFGPDADGKVSMNFGPLNKEGGERRLNVAVTRARDALTVVSSLQAEQIDLSKTIRLGPKLLRSYLEMARRGGDFTDLEMGIDTEKLVDSVERALAVKGWKIQRGVGTSALRLDIAIKHPEEAGKFLAGIECDGSDYRSAPTARDRERLRPAVLQGLGWKLLRVWALDWLKNPDGETARLEAELYRALGKAPDGSPWPQEPTDEVVGSVTADEPTTRDEGMVDVTELGIDEEPSTDFPAVELTIENESRADIRGTLQTYQPVELGLIGWQEEFRSFNDQSPKLREVIWRVVQGEGPIRNELLIQRVSKAWGFGRAGDLVSGLILLAINADPRLERRGLFVWDKDMRNAPLRVPALYEKPRPAEWICPEEIGEAAIHCVKEAVGLERPELVRQTARLLGFNRIGVNVDYAMNAAIDVLLKEGRLVERSGAVGLGEGLD